MLNGFDFVLYVIVLKQFFLIEVQLIYNVLSVSGVQQSDSVIHIYIYIYMYSFSDLFHYRLLKDIEYSSLCFTVGPCCLSILYTVVCIC